MKNIFENAYFGKMYKTRNNGIAFYCRVEGQKHCLMVNDKENDFILCMENGHIFDIDKLDKPIVGGKHNGKTAIELYGWNREELSNFRLDVVSEWQEEIDEKELDKIAENERLWYRYDNKNCSNTIDDNVYIEAFKAGYRKAKQK